MNQSIQLIPASSFKNKPDEQQAFVSEEKCPIHREEGKQVREKYRILPKEFYGLPNHTPMVIECCCQEQYKGTHRTPPCPYFGAIQKGTDEKGKILPMVECHALVLSEKEEEEPSIC